MNDHIERLIKQIDELVKAANPPDNSAPLNPILELGWLVAHEWKSLKTFLDN